MLPLTNPASPHSFHVQTSECVLTLELSLFSVSALASEAFHPLAGVPAEGGVGNSRQAGCRLRSTPRPCGSSQAWVRVGHTQQKVAQPESWGAWTSWETRLKRLDMTQEQNEQLP